MGLQNHGGKPELAAVALADMAQTAHIFRPAVDIF